MLEFLISHSLSKGDILDPIKKNAKVNPEKPITRSRTLKNHFPNSYTEIDLNTIVTNIDALKSRLPGKKVLVVVKCDAYRHGAVQVARHVEEHGCHGR
jgi:hypothetical protein